VSSGASDDPSAVIPLHKRSLTPQSLLAVIARSLKVDPGPFFTSNLQQRGILEQLARIHQQHLERSAVTATAVTAAGARAGAVTNGRIFISDFLALLFYAEM
jgi:hypothetical protein